MKTLIISILTLSSLSFSQSFTCKSEKWDLKVEKDKKGYQVILEDNMVLKEIEDLLSDSPELAKIMKEEFKKNEHNSLSSSCAVMDLCTFNNESDSPSLSCKKSSKKTGAKLNFSVNESGELVLNCTEENRNKSSKGSSNYNFGDAELVSCETGIE